MSEITPELEAVARAIYLADYHPVASRATWDDTADETRMHAFKMARAALSAIREPTARMSRAVLAEHTKGNSSFIDEYRAAIDSILSDTRTPPVEVTPEMIRAPSR